MPQSTSTPQPEPTPAPGPYPTAPLGPIARQLLARLEKALGTQAAGR